MNALLMACGLAGAWLLVAGPIYQAALELREHEIAVDRVEATRAIAEKTRPVSPWWWLLPPVKIWLENRRSEPYRRIYIEGLSVEQFTALVSFMHRATGWLMVASGGLLLATKETLSCLHAAPLRLGLLTSSAVVVALATACILFTVLRMRGTDGMIVRKREQATASKSASP